ncbi:MAG: methionyl aminopeptidase [Chlamydiia bacterium]|nr:methionyl aminopeptidase [Chlamydiia bacterium]
MKRNEPCFCNSNKKWKHCCFPNKQSIILTQHASNIIIKSEQEINKIREACQITKIILNKLCNFAKAGITTKEIDNYSMELHKLYNVLPAPLGYGNPPFPGSICISVNDVICHGIPGDYVLKDGDIANIDVSCIKDGFYGDASDMVTIGTVSDEHKKLIDITKYAVQESLKICKPHSKFSAIGTIIEDICTANNYSVVEGFVGHGVGIKFHERPQIYHCKNNQKDIMMPGMIFTIEPIINEGKEATYPCSNRWTYRTVDKKYSAQFEHTILITSDSYEILTK